MAPIQSYFARRSYGILGRFEAGCLPAYIQLAPVLSSPSFNIDEDSFASRTSGVVGEGGGNSVRILGWHVPQ